MQCPMRESDVAKTRVIRDSSNMKKKKKRDKRPILISNRYDRRKKVGKGKVFKEIKKSTCNFLLSFFFFFLTHTSFCFVFVLLFIFFFRSDE